MTAITYDAAMKKGARTQGLSLKERFVNYMKENSVSIICGLQAFNGSSNAYQTYAMLTKER